MSKSKVVARSWRSLMEPISVRDLKKLVWGKPFDRCCATSRRQANNGRHVCYLRPGHAGPHRCGRLLDRGLPCLFTWKNMKKRKGA